MNEDPFINDLEKLGYDVVRSRVTAGQYAGNRLTKASAWVLAIEGDRQDALHAETLNVASSARDAQWDAAASAREAAASAKAANDLAREANSVAEAANTLASLANETASRALAAAERQTEASRASAAIAAIAVLVSIILGLLAWNHR